MTEPFEPGIVVKHPDGHISTVPVEPMLNGGPVAVLQAGSTILDFTTGGRTFAIGHRASDREFEKLQAKVSALHARLAGAETATDAIEFVQVAPGRLTVVPHRDIVAAIAEIERDYANVAVLLRAENDADERAARG